MNMIEQLVEDLYSFEYDDNQLFFIIKGFKEGLDVSQYANPDFDALQMEQLYLGLSKEIDISLYQDPSIPFNKMKIIRLAIENSSFSEEMLLPFLDEKELFKISKSNDIVVSKKERAKFYYQKRKEQKEKTVVDDIELDKIDLDSIFDDNDSDIDFTELDFSASENLSNSDNWDSLNDYEYYFEHFYDLKPYNNYSEIIKKYPLLTVEEEIHFFKLISQGKDYIENWKIKSNINDETQFNLAKQALENKYIVFMSNIKLVLNIVTKFKINTIEQEDLEIVAFEGLEKAIDNFDYTKGYKFSTYAVWWIKQFTTRFILDNERLIRIPVHASEQIRKILRFEKDFCENFGHMPEDKDYKNNSEILINDVETARKVRQIISPPLSIEELMQKDEEAFLTSVIDGEISAATTKDLCLKEEINSLLSILKEREQQVLRLRFGLDTGSPSTLEEIGSVLCLTRERVRQIEAKALRDVRKSCCCNRLKDFLD